MTRKKKALLIGGGVAGVFLVVLLVAAWLFPAERVAAIAASHAEATLDRQVRIEAVRIRVFPRPAVALEGVAVSRHARPGGGTGSEGAAAPAGGSTFEPLLASVRRVQLRPRLLPLFRGDVIIDEVVVEGPGLFLEVPRGGTLDLPALTADEEPEARDVEIRIRRILVRDGTVEYRDENTGAVVVVTGIDHTLALSASVLEGELDLLELDGVLVLAQIDAELPEALATPLRGLGLRLEHDAVLHQAEDRLEIRRADAVLQEFPLSLAGEVTGVSDPETRSVELRAEAEDVDVVRLIASLPPEVLEDLPRDPEGRTLQGTGGSVSLEATASGRAGAGAIPGIAGTFRLDGVAIGYDGSPGDAEHPIRDLAGAIAFSLDSLSSDGLDGRLFGEPFHLEFALADLAEPHGAFEAAGALNLAEAGRAGFLPEGHEARGLVSFDLVGRGSTAELAGAQIDGEVLLDGLELRLPALAPTVEFAQTRIELDGQEAHTADLQIAVGRSDVAVDLRVREWLGFAANEGSGLPAVTFTVRSTLIDADELFETDPEAPSFGQILFAHLGNQRLDGRTAPEIADELELSLPDIPRALIDGRISSGTLVSGGLTYSNVDASVRSPGDGSIEVPNATLEIMDGRVRLEGRLGAAAEEAPRPLSLEYAVNEVTADPFLQHHTLFRGQVGGRLVLSGSAQMNLHPNTLPERESVTGLGEIVVLDGELRNWPLVRELGGTLGLPDFETLEFRDWGGRYRILGPAILLEESVLEAGRMAVRSSGSFDVAGSLDLTATFYLPGEWLARAPGAPAGLLTEIVGDDLGRVPIGGRVTGTTASPSIGLDFSEAGAIAAERAREEAEEAIRREAERLLDRFGIGRLRRDTVPPPDTLPRGR